MSNPLHHKDSKAHERPPIPLPDPDEVRHTFDVAMAKVRERQGFYTVLAIIVVLVTVGAIFLLNLGPATQPAEFLGLWKRADAVRQKLGIDKSARPELAELAAYLEDVRGTPVEGEALWLLGVYHYREAWTADKSTADDRRPDLQRSIGFLEQLERPAFDEVLLTKPNWYTSSPVSPATALLKQVREDLAWVDGNAYTEPIPNPSVVAVLRTSEGDVHLEFFGDLCPEHVKNFITHAERGTYNETLFYSVLKGDADDVLGVAAGDPLTFFYNDPKNKQHILRWGTGGVGYDIAPEGGRYRITHRPSIVTTLATRRMEDVGRRGGSDWDNGIDFMIVTGVDVDLDKRQTPFAKVVEGMSVVEKIAKKKTAGEHEAYKDDPGFSTIATHDLLVEPVTIHKVIIYENGKALAHEFPLEDGEKSLGTLSQAPVKPLTGDAVYGGRHLRAPDATGDVRVDFDIPFPDDVDPKTENPLGARKK